MRKCLMVALAAISAEAASADEIRSAYKEDLCMTVNDESVSGWRYGVNVEVKPCRAAAEQQFSFTKISTEPTSPYRIQSASGKCLAIDQSDSENWSRGNNIVVSACGSDPSQQFDLETLRDGWSVIHSRADGRCLDIDLNSAAGWRREKNVFLWKCHGEPNQRWLVNAQSAPPTDLGKDAKDDNHNGVRDDIEAYIQRTVSDSGEKSALMQLARYLQVATERTMDKEESIELYGKLFRTAECLSNRFKEQSRKVALSGEVRDRTLDTKEKAFAYFAMLEKTSGQSFKALPLSLQHTACENIP